MTGAQPDILAFDPDGRYAFVTLRVPPRSGRHAIHGDTPGVAVIDVATPSHSAVASDMVPRR